MISAALTTLLMLSTSSSTIPLEFSANSFIPCANDLRPSPKSFNDSVFPVKNSSAPPLLGRFVESTAIDDAILEAIFALDKSSSVRSLTDSTNVCIILPISSKLNLSKSTSALNKEDKR